MPFSRHRKTRSPLSLHVLEPGRQRHQRKVKFHVSIDTIARDNNLLHHHSAKIDVEGKQAQICTDPAWLAMTQNIAMELHPEFAGHRPSGSSHRAKWLSSPPHQPVRPPLPAQRSHFSIRFEKRLLRPGRRLKHRAGRHQNRQYQSLPSPVAHLTSTQTILFPPRRINRAIAELMLRRAISANSCGHANQHRFQRTPSPLARDQPTLGVGCHVVITDGTPLCAPETIPTLPA